jgi:acetyl-CoA carboxylase carboxyltransferase component
MSDESLIVNKTGSIFLAGSFLVKAAIGEDIDNETLGGATTHCEISGVTDYKMEDDASCLLQIRKIIDKLGNAQVAGFNRIAPALPKVDKDAIYHYVSTDNSKPYETRDLIKALVDDSDFVEYKELYGQSIVCGYARVDGWAVGIVANQRKVVKSKKGEMQFGGVIYNDSADKAARFIMNCNQKKIPLVFLQDVTGFMVGSRSEHAGIIKDGAKLVNAMSNSIVPKFTIIVGNSYGAGNYAMCGKAFDPRLIVAWPTAKIAVMGGSQAANTILQIKVSALQKKGEEITEEKKNEILNEIKADYDKSTTPYYAASRLWVDAIIDPAETRKIISIGIDAANHAPIKEDFRLGIIQT